MNREYPRFLAILLLLFASGTSFAAHFKTVIIDPGHGGRDSGAVSGKVYEKHLALDTALRLEALLKKRGYRTVMTRRGDYYLPLWQRAKIANQHKNAIFVSIHFNHTWRKGANGIETFYYGNNARALAANVQGGMLRKTKAENRQAKHARYYVLKNSRNPAILVEGGFVSNKEDREKMMGAKYRDALARGIAEGIHNYRKQR